MGVDPPRGGDAVLDPPRGGGGDPVSSREENVVTDSPRGEDETPAPPPGGESEINPSEADIGITDPLPQEEKQMADNRISTVVSTQLISDVHEGTGDVIGDSVVLSDDSMAVDIIEDIHKVEDTLEGIHDQSLERIGSTESINLPDSFSGAQPVYEPTVNTRASKKAQRGKRKGNNQPSAIPRKSKSTQKEPPSMLSPPRTSGYMPSMSVFSPGTNRPGTPAHSQPPNG